MKTTALLAASVAFAAALIATPALRSAAADEPVKKAAAAPTLCVVRGDVIADPAKAAGKADVNGKTYYFCCGGCKTAFGKADDAGKAKFAKRTDLRTEKAVLQSRLKSIDTELETIDGKPAVAATEKAATAAASKPVALQCAVTGEDIASVAEAAGGKTEVNGKTYYFCCPGCKTKFDSDKAKFAAEADKRKAGV